MVYTHLWKSWGWFSTSLHLQSLAPGLPVTRFFFPPGRNSPRVSMRPIERWGSGDVSPSEKRALWGWPGPSVDWGVGRTWSSKLLIFNGMNQGPIGDLEWSILWTILWGYGWRYLYKHDDSWECPRVSRNRSFISGHFDGTNVGDD